MSFDAEYIDGFQYHADLLQTVDVKSYDELTEIFKLHVSRLTGKMRDMRSIDTNPISNPFCRHMCSSEQPRSVICRNCYAIRSLISGRANCILPYECNSILLSNFNLPDECLPTKRDLGITRSGKVRAVRFNSYGELINERHVRNLFNICDLHPTVPFTLFFKNKAPLSRAIQKYGKPDNLIIIQSNIFLNDPDTERLLDGPERVPDYVDKIFSVYTPEFLQHMAAAGTPIRVNCRADAGACRYTCGGGEIGDIDSPLGRCYDIESAYDYVYRKGHPELVNEVLKQGSSELNEVPDVAEVIDSVRRMTHIMGQKATQRRFRMLEVASGLEIINELTYFGVEDDLIAEMAEDAVRY